MLVVNAALGAVCSVPVMLASTLLVPENRDPSPDPAGALLTGSAVLVLVAIFALVLFQIVNGALRRDLVTVPTALHFWSRSAAAFGVGFLLAFVLNS